MTEANSENIVFLVPGGLGTELSLNGTTVWTDDWNGLRALNSLRVILNPALLLPWVPLKAGKLLTVYDDLIKFLKSQGYTVAKRNLFLFGYDWRQGIDTIARDLAGKINNVMADVKPTHKLILIGHSFGCMVVKWAINPAPSQPAGAFPKIDFTKIKHIVAAGPHTRGMPGAFRDVLVMPEINEFFNYMFNLAKASYPKLTDQLEVPMTRALRAVTSEVELMPPNSDKIIQKAGSPNLGAFDWSGWPSELNTMRNRAKLVVDYGSQPPVWPAGFSVPRTLIYSKSFPTDTGVVLDVSDAYLGMQATKPGDDSVLVDSALAYDCTSKVVVSSNHHSLLDDPVARTRLSAILK